MSHEVDLKSEGDVNFTEERRFFLDNHIGETTRHWLDQDKRLFLHQSLSTPCLNVLQSCHDGVIQDLEGRAYFDFHGNNVHQVGFGNPRVIKAIEDQMSSLSFCTRRYTNIPAIKLAQKLVDLAPGDLSRVLFAPGGTSAIGMALKLARYKTGRFKTISMWDSFHGASLDAISIGGEAVFRNNVGPLLPGAEHVPPPDAQNCPWDCQGTCNLKCADYIEYVLRKEGDVAAVIAETVRSTPYIPSKEYWQKVRAACDKHGALLILDEIPHCLGRTGRMFSFEHFDMVPDMVVIGKGLGGGIFPLAALLAKEDLNIAQDRAVGHYTHEKNPVACAAALATIEYLEEEHILDHVSKVGAEAMVRLEQMHDTYQVISDVRGIGLMMGMELRNSDGTRAFKAAEKLMYACLQNGLSFKLTMGNIALLTPALTISSDDMQRALDILERSLDTI